MDKVFRDWNFEQATMFPATIQDFVPPGHLATFVRNLVVEQLDLTPILNKYREKRGCPPYHPAMLTALLLYAYTQNIYSSRRIAAACTQRVDFMAVTGKQQPDFRTISDFRKRHLKPLGKLFQQVLRLCQQAGMVKLSHVSLDGTRVAANAAKDQTLKYGRMKRTAEELQKEVEEWLNKANKLDEAEDELYGADRSGDELPDWVADKQKRLEKLRQAQKELETEAQAEAEKEKQQEEQKEPQSRKRTATGETPEEDAKRNLSDADSRLMRTSHGFIQGYNAQLAVDADSQVIVAQMVSSDSSDCRQMAQMLEQIQSNTGDAIQEISADSGYYSEQNVELLEQEGIRGYIGCGRRDKDGTWHGDAGPNGKRMRSRINRGGKRSRYRLRKQTVEPVFGIIKSARGFRQFLMRGISKVSEEWSLIATAHNIDRKSTRLNSSH